MFIEPGLQKNSGAPEERNVDLVESTLRSYGAEEFCLATWAINIWPLCG